MKGRFWVAEREGRVVGSVGFSPGKKPGYAELKKLYVDCESADGYLRAARDITTERGAIPSPSFSSSAACRSSSHSPSPIR